MPAVVPGLWLVNPKKAGTKKRKHRKAKLFRKRRRRSRKNTGKLTILNPRKRGGSMARKRRRSRRRKVYAKKRKVYRRKRRKSYAKKRSPRRRRVYRRRRKSYAKNPKRYARKRRRSRRRRNSPIRSISRRSYGAARSLFSMGMAKNVIAGVAGFAGVNFIEPYIPYVPSTPMGLFVKKGIAAVAAYMIAGIVPGISRSQRKYVLYGAAFNIGLDVVKMQFPDIAAKGGLSGFSGYGQGLDMPQPTPARLIPTALIPAVLQ